MFDVHKLDICKDNLIEQFSSYHVHDLISTLYLLFKNSKYLLMQFGETKKDLELCSITLSAATRDYRVHTALKYNNDKS